MDDAQSALAVRGPPGAQAGALSATLRRGPVVKPSPEEVAQNPRSASARLRVAYRTGEPVGGES